jgi:outer membrane putative beta-barrel porin/alpha-amylase
MKWALAWLAACALTPALASHPLITENTNVLGEGVWELELHGERARDDEQGTSRRRSDVAAKLGCGIAHNADLEFELPYVREVTDGGAVEGRGDASLSVKWRFHEKEGFSLAFKPNLLLPTGRDEVGLGAGRVRWALNVAGAYEAGRLEVIAHLGYTQNRNRVGERSSLWHASAALLYSLTERLRLLADYSDDSRPDPAAGSHGRELVVGATYAVSERIDLGLGLKKGLNDAADDRALRAGVKLRW